METVDFKIVGLDCAEEVAILKRVLGPIVGGETYLRFDILNGKLGVVAEADPNTVNTIREAVAKTGMRAIPWATYQEQSLRAGGLPFWERRGRAILCTVSGLMLSIGTIIQGLEHGWLAVLGAHSGDGHGAPPYLIALYIASISTGVWYVLPKAWYSARSLRPDMNLLMVVAICGAIGIGEWMEAATVAFLFSLALLLESWSVGRARRAIESLVDLSPTIARCWCPTDKAFEEKPADEVAVNALVQVRPGEKIPLDGKITKGSTLINEAPITGESVPSEKEPGDDVFAGTVNQTGVIEVTVTRAAEDSTLAQIIRMVEEAHGRRAPSEQWVEKFAKIYTPAMMGFALAVAVIPPLFTGEWGAWFYQALVILVIACPCALVISTPVSIVAGLTSAAKEGILIKGGIFLEIPARLRAIAFDKTGTITRGKAEVQSIVPFNGHDDSELLARAAAMESHSEHPFAEAILRKADDANIDVVPAENFQSLHGRGAEAVLNGREFWIGSHRFLHEKGTETAEHHRLAEEMEDAGHSVIAIGNEEHVCGLISVADSIRETSAPMIKALKKAGIAHVIMLTGDNAGTAKAVAEEIGVDAYRAELLPHEKVEVMNALVAEYGTVAMVGDGVNDAPAMAASDLGIAMAAAGSDAAIETADIALMSDDLSKIPWLVAHSKRTLRIIKQNIFFALGLKLAFAVLALFGLATLWMAIAADMGASLIVIFNGLRLLRA